MSVTGTVDISLDSMGGLVLDMAPSDLPDGVSPDCQDVAFKPGAVFTRPGLASLFAAIAGNPTLTYLKTYTQPNLTEVLLALDSLGSLWSAQTVALAQINAGVGQAIVAGARGKSTTLFGREYLALGDGKFGIDIPRQYDGTFFDRVSQVGPGEPGIIGDAPGAAVNIAASATGLIPLTDNIATSFSNGAGYIFVLVTAPNPPAGTVQVGDKMKLAGTTNGLDGEWAVSAIGAYGYTYTLASPLKNAAVAHAGTITYNLTKTTTTTANTMFLGGTGTIAGAGVAGYNGTWNVRSITSNTVCILYITGADALANSGGGTLAGGGSISAGVHGFGVLFVTRQGYITKPSSTINWNAAGNMGAAAGQIPIGPSNIKQRILIFTVAAGANFFYLPSFIINDNTTTSFTVSFTDAALAAGTPVNAPGQNLFIQVELGESLGSIGYAGRVFWWGERNHINNFQNLTFDGGWDLAGGTGGSDVPLGWASDATYGAGGSKDSVNVVWGDAYRITGNGNANVGMITQSVFQDFLSARILQDQTAYSVRVKAKKGGGITQGNLTIDIYSPSLAMTLGTLSIPVAAIGTTVFSETISALITAQNIAADAVLRVYLTGTPTNGGWIVIDNIELYPTATPYLATQVRASSIFANFGGALPEGFDGVSGVLQMNQNAQPVRAAFVITDRSSLTANDHLHFVKEGSLYRTQDNGGLPSTWSITQVSGVVGTPSVHGVDVGEDWVVIAHPSGLYLYYFGSEPNKISQEIQPLWDQINWSQAGHTVWVRVDTLNKRILVGAPFNGALTPNKILALDYRGLISASQIIETPPVHFSAYSGKILSLGLGRKWSPWTISANCAWFEAPNEELGVGQAGMFFGNSAGNGKIYNLQNSQLSDDGVAIPSYYQTYYFPSQIQEPMLKLRTHRKLFSYLTGFIEGSGSLSLSAFLDGNQFSNPLPSLNLINTAAPSAITTITRKNGLVTVTCALGHGLTQGIDLAVVIGGVADNSMNGVFPIQQILSATAFTVSQIGLADSYQLFGNVGRLLRDFELTTNLEGERCSYKFATNGLNAWFRLQKLSPSLQNSAWAPVRGGM
jgi:hypothetical protein